MQPILVLSAPHPGILYINGGFAGEISHQSPLFRPVSAQGALYLDYRPITNACMPMARRLVFSGGEPMVASADDAEDMNIVVWPGGVTEIEFEPRSYPAPVQRFQLAGHDLAFEAEGLRLSCDGHALCTLPEGAQLPEFRRLKNGCALIGSCSGGKYLLTTDESLKRQTGLLRAGQLDIEADERIRAVNAASDLVGHATLETWRLAPEGLMLVSSEAAWAHGAPRWPATSEDTARAAVEAALEGLISEAENYLSPALRMQDPLHGIGETCDLCVKMRYAPPDARPCVGLLRLEGEHMARVRPLYYRAVPFGGPQGPWQIEAFEFE